MNHNRIWWVIALLITMIVLGTITYILLENWNVLDSLYMTVIVLTTIGFSEVHPLSVNGRIFTIIFSLIGFGILAVAISILSSSIIEGDILGNRRRKKMLQNMKRLKNHLIVCGAGKVGKHVITSIREAKRSFVAIDITESALSQYHEENGTSDCFFIQGDATDEKILQQAGVERAYGLISCVRDDAKNLFICLTAKKLNPNIKISSYVIDEVNMSKFYMVGADEVVSGDFVIGKRLIVSLLNENIASFLEQTNYVSADEAFFLGDVVVSDNSRLINKSIREADIYRKVGLLIFAYKSHSDNSFTFNPDASIVLNAGDTLVTFGSQDDLERLKKFVNG